MKFVEIRPLLSANMRHTWRAFCALQVGQEFDIADGG